MGWWGSQKSRVLSFVFQFLRGGVQMLFRNFRLGQGVGVGYLVFFLKNLGRLILGSIFWFLFFLVREVFQFLVGVGSQVQGLKRFLVFCVIFRLFFRVVGFILFVIFKKELNQRIRVWAEGFFYSRRDYGQVIVFGMGSRGSFRWNRLWDMN